MAKVLTNLSKLPFANNTTKLSEKISIESIEEHPKFKELFPIDDELLERITENIKEKGFDESQPVHIWKTTDDDGNVHQYLIDGYTRVLAAKNAGLETVPTFEHRFETFDEAYKYSLHLQVDRRQLSDSDLMKNLRVLLGSEYVEKSAGNTAQKIADELKVSKRTAAKALSVEKTATDEQKARIDEGKATINQVYNENHPKKEEEPLDEENEEAEEENFAEVESAEADTEENEEAENPTDNPFDEFSGDDFMEDEKSTDERNILDFQGLKREFDEFLQSEAKKWNCHFWVNERGDFVVSGKDDEESYCLFEKGDNIFSYEG